MNDMNCGFPRSMDRDTIQRQSWYGIMIRYVRYTIQVGTTLAGRIRRRTGRPLHSCLSQQFVRTECESKGDAAEP